MSTYNCTICERTFGFKRNLIRHHRLVHTKDKKVIICSECDVSSPTKRKFLLHWRTAHSSPPTKRNFSKICPLCKCEEKDIMKHYTNVHDIQIDEKSLYFDDLNCFDAWKKEIEEKTLSKFVHKRTNKGVNVVKMYICNRSGVYQSQSKGIRRLKTQGYRKINGFCPASMVVTISALVHVKFIDCHVGHKHEICHFNISPTKKEIIASKLMNNVPKMCILEEIRDSCGGVAVSRDDLINNQDIKNIAAKYNVSQEYKKYKTNAISADITCKDLQKERDSLVRFLEPLKNQPTSNDQISNIPPVGFNSEDFLNVGIVEEIEVNFDDETESILKEIGMKKQADVDHEKVQNVMNDVLHIVNSNPCFRNIFYKDMKTLQLKYEALMKNRISMENLAPFISVNEMKIENTVHTDKEGRKKKFI